MNETNNIPGTRAAQAGAMTVVRHFNGRNWIWQIGLADGTLLLNKAGRVRSFPNAAAARRTIATLNAKEGAT